jgi:hypothetical protein
MADNRKLIGNEFKAGTRALAPQLKRANKLMIDDYRYVKKRRQHYIDLVAAPPPMPIAKKVLPAEVTENNKLNQISYNILIIAILAGIGSVTNFINWEFLIYGIVVILVRLPSTQMFMAAIMSLMIIPLTSFLHKAGLANDFSVIAFYFLLIGLVEAALELRRESKVKLKIPKIQK